MNFFKIYDEYTQETEPAKKYHLHGAVSIISNMLGKRCWFPMGHFNIYPNFYLLFVGLAGNRKTTALSMAEKIFVKSSSTLCASTLSTSEAIIDMMASTDSRVNFNYKRRQYAFQQYSPYCSEFNTFLGGRHINEGLVKFLTDIYDRDSSYTYKTKNKGTATIENPFFSFLGACTTDWLTTAMKGNLITSGFARRILFIYADTVDKPIYLPKKKFNDGPVIEAAKQLANLSGPFSMTIEAERLYEKFYIELMSSLKGVSPILESYYSTKHVLVLKMCMVLSAGSSNLRVITSEIFNLAVEIFDEIEYEYTHLFASAGENKLAKFAQKILDDIKKEPRGIITPRLMKAYYKDLNNQEFTEVIEVLRRTEQIQVTEESSRGVPYSRLTAAAPADKKQDLYLLSKAARLACETEEMRAFFATQPVVEPDFPAQESLPVQSGIKIKVTKFQEEKTDKT